MSFDSLSQIVTLPMAMQCAAVDLHFTEAGGDVLVSLDAINESGVPVASWAQLRVQRAAIKVDGSATRVTWPVPVMLAANTQCAVTVAASDATTSLQIGQLGEQATTGGLVTAAQAAIGQLVHVNPAGLVTRYASRMMKFSMLGVKYTEPTKTVRVGSVPVVNATAVIVNAGADQPAGDSRVTFTVQLMDANGVVVREMLADSGQGIQLTEPHTGTAAVNATLRLGGGEFGPVLQPGTVLAVGTLLTTGTYVTTALQTNGGSDLRVIFDADIPGGAGVKVDAQLNDAGAWIAVPWESSSPQTAGSIELLHRKTGLVAQSIRLRLTLTGSTTARPKVRNLRAVVV